VQHLRDVGHHTFLIFFLFCYIYMCMCIVFWLSSDVHGPSLFKSTFFCLGLVRPRDFGIFTTHPKLSKYFKYSKESHFWS